MGKRHDMELTATVKTRATVHTERRQTPTPSAIGGAILGGLAVGQLFGPIGAIAGFVAGGIAGEVYERRTLPRDGKAMVDTSEPHHAA